MASWARLFDRRKDFRRHQVVQDETYGIQVQFEAPAAGDSSIEHRVRDILKPVLPGNVVIETRRVDRIHSTAGAKRRFVQSRVTRAVA